jgi:hypothetical protein
LYLGVCGEINAARSLVQNNDRTAPEQRSGHGD